LNQVLLQRGPILLGIGGAIKKRHPPAARE
jgi:hypothetical protein